MKKESSSVCLRDGILWLGLALVLLVLARAASSEPGDSHFSQDGYIEYIEGNLPIILSAPHGGRRSHPNIPRRKEGTSISDTNSDRVAKEISEAFFERTGAYPHVVISHLQRAELDCNRNLERGAAGNPLAEEIWKAYHAFIDKAKETVLERYPSGLYVDLHAHGHQAPLVELGYLLRGFELKQSREAIDALADRSSIRELAQRNQSSLSELLQGPSSFGSLLQQNGIEAVPSQTYPHPGNRPYFNGGYNTWRHGSKTEGSINGFQAEIPYYAILSGRRQRLKFASAFVEASLSFFQTHEGISLNKTRKETVNPIPEPPQIITIP